MSAVSDVLAQHNHPVYGQFAGPRIGAGAHVKCPCGWVGRISYRDMDEGDHDSDPYLDRLFAQHQSSMIKMDDGTVEQLTAALDVADGHWSESVNGMHWAGKVAGDILAAITSDGDTA